jgi:hypothetical protein
MPTIIVTFSEAVQTFTAQQGFSVSDGANPVVGTISWSGSTLSFVPDNELAQYAAYSVIFQAGSIVDMSGNAMVGGFSSGFTTGAGTKK